MAWLITAVVAVGALTTKMQVNAGAAQKIELDKQAEQEKIAAQGREVARRQNLNKVLAGNIVGLANSGMSGEGTPASINLENAKQTSLSEGLAGLSDKLKQAQLKRQANNARTAGNVAGASTLLNTGIQAASLSAPTPAPKGP